MESFFQEQFYGGDDLFWFSSESHPVHRSAFMPYPKGALIEVRMESIGNWSKPQNAIKRMIEFLRRINQSAKKEAIKPEIERSHLHMINERIRRKREQQSYSALHSMLPIGTKVSEQPTC